MNDDRRRTSAFALRGLASFCVLLSACDAPPEPIRYPITLRAESDPGVPLEGVAVTLAGISYGGTGADGLLRVELTGDEGTTVAVSASCPEGHRAGAPLAPIVLRRLVDTAGAPAGLRIVIACPPALRHGVVMVHAMGPSHAGLPVLIEGLEMAVTDAEGVARVPLDRAPGVEISVMIATAVVSPLLRPTDPQMTFTFPDADQTFSFEQTFEQAPLVPTGRSRTAEGDGLPPGFCRLPVR